MPVNKTIRNFLYSLLLITFISSCRQNEYLIPSDKFVDVLVDLHLADAIALQNTPASTGFILDSANLYGSVFKEHGISEAMFDSTVSYYGSHPEEFLQIYDKVIAKLQLMNDELIKQPLAGAMSELVWEDSRVYAFPEMDTGRVEINVPVRITGEYTVSATIKLYKDDESRNPSMTLYFWYDDNTPGGYSDPFPEVKLKKSDEQLTYTATKVLDDVRITHIKGYVLDYSNRKNDFIQHALVSEVTVTIKHP
jgi:hypothetical protein